MVFLGHELYRVCSGLFKPEGMSFWHERVSRSEARLTAGLQGNKVRDQQSEV